jgi:serine/threonine protein kinase
VFSLGAILYDMLTGRRPSHRGASAPSASNSHVPPELDQIALKAVAPNPDSRYQSMASLTSDLRNILTVLDVREDAAEEEQRQARSTSVGRVLLMSIALLLVAGLIVWLVTLT